MGFFKIVTIVVLLAVALGHALRVALGWTATVNGVDIPPWASVAGLLLPAFLAVGLWRERPSEATESGLSSDALHSLLNSNSNLTVSAPLLAKDFVQSGGTLGDERMMLELNTWAKARGFAADLDLRGTPRNPANVKFRPREA